MVKCDLKSTPFWVSTLHDSIIIWNSKFEKFKKEKSCWNPARNLFEIQLDILFEIQLDILFEMQLDILFEIQLENLGT